MTSLARWTALLLGAVLVACSWLPWAGASKALTIPFKTLWDPGYLVLTQPSYLTTLALALWLAGALVVVGALVDARSLVVIGALAAVAIHRGIWILSQRRVHLGIGGRDVEPEDRRVHRSGRRAADPAARDAVPRHGDADAALTAGASRPG